MIDFETLGTGKNACVIQIGACYFDRLTGEIGDTFFCNVDPKSAIKSGAEMDADTVYWWMKQSEEARDSVMEPPREDIYTAFEALNEFLYNARHIWSHATFDFVIMSETLKRLSIRPNFKYISARDIRTLTDLADVRVDAQTFPREGIHHNGLDDCKYQVKYCVACFKALKNGTIQSD